MGSSLYQSLMTNNMTGMIKQFRQFQRMFTGDPRTQVQDLLQSRKMSQAQFNQYQSIADQMMDAMKH